MSRDAHLLAQIMCQLTESVVWPHVEAIAKSKGHSMFGRLVTRSGSGVKTYHTHKPVDGQYSHVITYGKKMIEKKKDFGAAPCFLTGKEIQKKGFFQGEMSYKNLIAHTVLHEACHGLQNALGHRHKNEVHNKAFYALLRDLHNVCGQQVVQELESAALKQGVSLDFHPESYEINEQGEMTDTQSEIRKDQGYVASLRGDRCLVVVTDVGDLRSDILVYGGKHKGASYKASNKLLKPLAEGDRQPDPGKDIPKAIPWASGDHCHFYGKNKTYCGGYIQKVNPKKCVVKVTEGLADYLGHSVNVPKSMLKEGNKEFPNRHPSDQSRSVTFGVR